MSESPAIAAVVAELWIERTIDSYPVAVRLSLISEADPFRNPAGSALKVNLTTLAREVLGAMDMGAMEPAIDALVRLRAVQDFTTSDALRFVLDLRTVIAEISGPITPALDCRIDELTRMTFEKYTACREQIAGLRAKEVWLRTQNGAMCRGRR